MGGLNRAGILLLWGNVLSDDVSLRMEKRKSGPRDAQHS